MAVDVSSIQFWHMQIHQQHQQERSDVHDVRQILEEYHFIGLADWEEGEKQIRDFLEVMRVNDIVAIKHGQQLVALTQVIGEAYDINKDRSLYIAEKEDPLVDWMRYRRPVKILDWAKEGQTIPHKRRTLTKYGNKNKPTNQTIIAWHKRC
ncbi:pyruvate kinase [Helicobacter pylori]|nr:pyruvate kinase [Helicobacter pylori]